MQKLATTQSSMALALTLALASCSDSSTEQINEPQVPLQNESIDHLLEQVKLPALPVSSVDEKKPEATVATNKQILEQLLSRWNARSDTGSWELNLEDRNLAYELLGKILQLESEVEFEFDALAYTDSVISQDGIVSGKIFADRERNNFAIPFSLHLESAATTLVGISHEAAEFGKAYEGLMKILKPIYDQLDSCGIEYASPQPRTSREIYLPVLAYLRDRFYPALVGKVVLDLEREKLVAFTGPEDLASRVGKLARDLSPVSFRQAELFEVDFYEGGSLGIQISNGWSSDSEIRPEYQIKMAFGLSSDEAFPVNARLSTDALAGFVREISQIVAYEKPNFYQAGFVNNTLAIMTYSAPEKNSLGLEIHLLRREEGASSWSSSPVQIQEVQKQDERLCFQSEGRSFEYLPAYARLSVDSKFFAPVLFGSKGK